MALSDSTELNSTARLLDSIRMANEKDAVQVPGPIPAPADSSAGTADAVAGNASTTVQGVSKKYALHQSSSHRKVAVRKSTLGVFFESDHIALALTEGKSAGARPLVKWSHAVYPDGITMESDRFPAFLKSTLSAFVGKNGKLEVWTSIAPKSLKLRYFTIPMLPEAKKANAVFWGMKKEVEIDSEIEAFDFQSLGEMFDGGTRKEKVIGFAAPKEEIVLLKKLFIKAGFPLTGISALPFALQNFIRAGMVNTDQEPLFSIVLIAKEYTEISCFSGEELLLVRNIKTGSFSLSEDMDTSSMERLVGKIARTSDYCSNQYMENRPLQANLFFGETDDSRKFMEFAAEYIDARVVRFDPFAGNLLQSGILVSPESARLRSGIIPAFGLAHSVSARTPNFLFTYVHRDKRKKYRKMNAAIAVCLAVCLAVCGGIYLWRASVLKSERAGRQSIEKELAAYNPRVNNEAILKLISSISQRKDRKSAYTANLQPLAVINEMSSLTPGSVRLISLEMDFQESGSTGEPVKAETGASKGKKNQTPASVIVVSGFVDGEYTSLESELTSYLLKLGDSPLFGEISIRSKEVGKYKGIDNKVLTFAISMEIL